MESSDIIRLNRQEEMYNLCKELFPVVVSMLMAFILLVLFPTGIHFEPKINYEEKEITVIKESNSTSMVLNDSHSIATRELIKEVELTPVYKYELSEEDRLFFEQIISAEAYSFWTTEECLALASVIINRVESTDRDFANVNTIREVLEQDKQFETYSNERYLTVPVSDSAKEAVDLALQGKTNVAEDVLFFCTEEFYETTSENSFWQKNLEERTNVRNVVFFSIKK